MDPDLARLAARHGVAVEYEDYLRRPVAVSPDAVIGVLEALGVDASSPAAVRAALAEPAVSRSGPVVVRESELTAVAVPLAPGQVRIELERGEHRDAVGADAGNGLARVDLSGTPLGWHTIESGPDRLPLIVVPDRLHQPPGRHWGWMTQLYALPSSRSWGIGDLADLRTLAVWTARHGGDVVLVNPLHAVAPLAPMQPSPYYPASRRWTNPVYLRVEDTDEYAAAPADVRAAVDVLRPPDGGDRIDRDQCWAAKSAALQVLFADCDKAAIDRALDTDVGLHDFATWCALCELHGNDWRDWPTSLQRPDAPEVARFRGELADRVRYHAWLQLLCAEQLDRAQRAAVDAGMAVGVVHDLAVGTDPAGADAWALQDALALGAHIGAPPDSFNQQGQDWGMPPWHPTRLAQLGYLPLRHMLRATLAHAGGVRIDHVLGLFRIWCVPQGASARDGTYVTYDADALLGIVTLEAQRADAIVIGEDLGTVPREVRTRLADRGILGTSVLWFERESPVAGKRGRIRPLDTWRADAVGTVTTHDLPTVTGWLRGEHVALRGELGLLDDPEAERVAWERDRDEVIELLRSAGLVGAEPTETDVVRALHVAVASTPCRYVLAAPGDAVGDRRQPNLPNTTDEHPNWRLAVTDAEGRVLTLDQLLADTRVERLADDLSAAVR